MEPIHHPVTNLMRTGVKYQVDQTRSTRLTYQSLPKNKGKPSHEGELDTQPIVLSTYADVRAFLLSDDKFEEDILGPGEEMDEEPQAAVNYADLKAFVDDYYNENIAHRDQTDKLVEASMSSFDKSSNTISDLYKGLNIITVLLKEIKDAVKDDSVINKKITEASESFTKFSINITDLQSSVNTLQAHALKQDEELAACAKSSTNTAWNLGSRLSASRINKGKGIASESEKDSSKKLVPASTIVHPDPDALIPYTINGEVYHLTAKQLQEQIDKEELIKKAEEKARLLAISKPEVIKVVQEEAEKIGLDLKKIASAKAGEKFKKAQDAEHQVLKREHTKKVRKSLELRKHKFESYMWTINNRLKPETITDIKIHPKTKPVVITVYRGTDGRNFDVHRPFSFGAFGISELDELREIIPKKKNAVVYDLMNSLSRRYERIRKILEELGIKSALPAPAPKQASS
ncbi:hypothetical protein Tco_0622144 [Tanacetum coccineum]